MLRLTASIAVVGFLITAAPAAASYFIDQRKAEHYARLHFHEDVGYHYTSAACHPQGRKRPEPGYVYHRWGCYFAVGDSRFSPSCVGIITIIGSRTASTYYWRVNFHTGKCPWGTE